LYNKQAGKKNIIMLSANFFVIFILFYFFPFKKIPNKIGEKFYTKHRAE
jgi:hypothetical protein